MKSRILIILAAAAAIIGLAACNDTKSYAELLNEETIAVNSYLADQVVRPEIPADTVFVTVEEAGDKAPYYQLDEDGNVFMQVVRCGTGPKAVDDQLIFFRFTRYNLYDYSDGVLGNGEGNDGDLSAGSSSFLFNNYQRYSSYQWGTGLQQPLRFLPIDCEVNLVVKSQSGVYDEVAAVQPFLYRLRYFKAQI